MNTLTIRLIVPLLCGSLVLAAATSSNAEDPKKKDTKTTAASPTPSVSTRSSVKDSASPTYSSRISVNPGATALGKTRQLTASPTPKPKAK